MKLRIFSAWLLMTAGAAAYAECDDIWRRDSLTDGFFGLKDTLAESGVESAFSLMTVYQNNVKGGLSTSRRSGRFQGSYDLELTFDLQHLLDIEGIFYLHGEGGWSDGIDPMSVGSAFGVNFDAIGDRSMDIAECYYEGAFVDGTLQVRIGKMDMRGGFECRGCPVSFDGSMYANDEVTQFLNGALVNNPTIPFPTDYALAAIVHWNPIESWYLSFGATDAEGVRDRTGFDTLFDGDAHFLYVAETGITPRWDSANGPMQGAYRMGLWYDPRPKAYSGGPEQTNDLGFYLSCDQMLAKENADEGDTQGLGGFCRYGYAPKNKNDITQFYSFGVQYQGLFDGRDDDVLGLGYANGIFSNDAAATFTADYESVFEIYYSAAVAGWMTLTPSVQYVSNPGGDSTVDDAIILGLRTLITF